MMSDGGAYLIFDHTLCLPSRFYLSIEGTSEVQGCEVRQTSGERVRVGFIDAALVTEVTQASSESDVPAPATPRLHRIRR